MIKPMLTRRLVLSCVLLEKFDVAMDALTVLGRVQHVIKYKTYTRTRRRCSAASKTRPAKQPLQNSKCISTSRSKNAAKKFSCGAVVWKRTEFVSSVYLMENTFIGMSWYQRVGFLRKSFFGSVHQIIVPFGNHRRNILLFGSFILVHSK